MDGVLAIDKPAGVTSHDVVDEVRRRLGTRRVGHAGTLDPPATGVLLIGVGRATKLLGFAQAGPKRYRAVASFGTTTSTQDASGEVLQRKPAPLTAADVSAVLPRFVGAIDQVPPMVSAVRVGGERLYKKARRGEEVARAARRVVVHELRLEGFEGGTTPEATLDVLCSSGTYVRTLVSDLGDALGCGAHVKALRRTESAGFTQADLVLVDEVTPATLRPLLDAVRELPRMEVDDDDAVRVRHGRPLAPGARAAQGERVAVLSSGELLGVYALRGASLVAERVVVA